MSDRPRLDRAERPRLEAPERRGLHDPRMLNRVLVVVAVVSAALIAADPLVEKHPHFQVEGWFAFYALLGAAAAAVAILVARLLRPLVRRPEDYYG